MTVPLVAVGDFATATWAASVAGAVPPATWTAYVPAWTAVSGSPVVNNGTLTGYYLKIADGYLVRIRLVVGSTTTFGTGAWSFSTPFARNAADSFDGAFNGVAFGGSSNRYLVTSTDATTSTFTLATNGSTTTGVGGTVPFAWASGHILGLRGFYEGV